MNTLQEKKKRVFAALLGVPLIFGGTHSNASHAEYCLTSFRRGAVSSKEQMFSVDELWFDGLGERWSESIRFTVTGISYFDRSVKLFEEKPEVRKMIRIEGMNPIIDSGLSGMRGCRLVMEFPVTRPTTPRYDRLTFIISDTDFWQDGSVLFDDAFRTLVREMMRLAGNNWTVGTFDCRFRKTLLDLHPAVILQLAYMDIIDFSTNDEFHLQGKPEHITNMLADLGAPL
jgi:uncharacterized protein YneR